MGLAVVAATAQGVVATQLGFTMDGSGSISAANFTLMKNGYAAAFAGLPIDGSVEVTLVQFAGGGTVVEIAPTVITSVADRTALIAAVNAITQNFGGTPMAAGIDLTRSVMTGSANFNGGAVTSIINIATDGAPDSGAATVTAALNAEAALIDALTAEAIGTGASTTFLSSIVFGPTCVLCPTPGGGTVLALNAAPPNPITSNPWVVPVSDFNAFGDVIDAKIQAVVNPTPEPGSLGLLAAALAGLGWFTRRGNRAA
jgi:hypothetical protein